MKDKKNNFLVLSSSFSSSEKKQKKNKDGHEPNLFFVLVFSFWISSFSFVFFF